MHQGWVVKYAVDYQRDLKRFKRHYFAIDWTSSSKNKSTWKKKAMKKQKKKNKPKKKAHKKIVTNKEKCFHYNSDGH